MPWKTVKKSETIQVRDDGKLVKKGNTLKRVCITGAKSYIGESVERWIHEKNEAIEIVTYDTLSPDFKDKSFAGFDSVFHVAGIAHVSADPSKEELYYKVNRDLTIETANRAKADGAKQFIFMSSIIVYGNEGNKGLITRSTKESPVDFYGKSKLMAEEGIRELSDDSFHVAIIRPPMIYGKNSKGNYRRLAALAGKIPVFPLVNNQRSMLHIHNLCEFVYLLIVNHSLGTFYPQNREYVNTSLMVKEIGACHGKNIVLVKGFHSIIRFLAGHINVFRKMFGDMAYEKSLSDHFDGAYCVVDFKESIVLTEK